MSAPWADPDSLHTTHPWADAVKNRLKPGASRQVIIITAVALALYFVVRLLPTGTNLSHMDFRVEGKGALEFCDPANPQFIPVVQARSPIVLQLKGDVAPAAGQPVNFTLVMHTASGKPIAPEDLLVAHTRKLHLMVVDPTLSDYQHIHPEPGRHAGEWVFTMTPQRSGLYRVFADFTPAATQRGLYGVAEFTVPGPVPVVIREANNTYQAAGFNFMLDMPPVLQAGKPADLRLRIESQGAVKQPVPLRPVMDAFAHLVAFDEARSGFAHLHPKELDLTRPPDALHPELNFKVTIPASGRYAIWAQVNLAGTEVFAPFWVDVLP